MTKMLFAALAASTFLVPAAASAQALAAPVVAVVNIQRVQTQCNACKTALTQLESQLAGLRTLQTSLETPLRAEAAALQAASQALNGSEPDAALQARATAFQKKQSDGQAQLARARADLPAQSRPCPRADQHPPRAGGRFGRHAPRCDLDVRRDSDDPLRAGA